MYVVLEDNPEKLNDVDVVVPADEPFKNSSYPEAPEDAVQPPERLLVVMFEKYRLVGADGAGGGPATVKLPETLAEPIGVLPLFEPLRLIVVPGVTSSVPENKTSSAGWVDLENDALAVPLEVALADIVTVPDPMLFTLALAGIPVPAVLVIPTLNCKVSRSRRIALPRVLLTLVVVLYFQS